MFCALLCQPLLLGGPPFSQCRLSLHFGRLALSQCLLSDCHSRLLHFALLRPLNPPLLPLFCRQSC